MGIFNDDNALSRGHSTTVVGKRFKQRRHTLEHTSTYKLGIRWNKTVMHIRQFTNFTLRVAAIEYYIKKPFFKLVTNRPSVSLCLICCFLSSFELFALSPGSPLVSTIPAYAELDYVL